MRAAALWAWVIVAALQTSCLSSVLPERDSKSLSYDAPSPGENWERLDPAEADAVYRNRQDHAVLSINSVCGKQRLRPLEDLSEDLLKQLPSHRLVAPARAIKAGGFPGLVTEAEGTLDGRPLAVRLAIVRTSRCLYDFMLAGEKLDASSRQAFEHTLANFREERRL